MDGADADSRSECRKAQENGSARPLDPNKPTAALLDDETVRANKGTAPPPFAAIDENQDTDYQRERAEWLAAVHAADESHEARPYLILLEGGIAGTPYRMEGRVQTLGRAPENGVQILAAAISRQHLRFAIGDSRQAWVTDLGSSNGTTLNNRRVPPKVTVPLRHGDQLVVGSAVRLQFVWLSSTDERDFLKRYERMIRDGLTGLHNRLFFQDQAESRIQRGFSRGLGAAVALMDLDGFKPFNDRHGHDVGDDVLRGVADLLRELAPEDGLTTRHGGEEFLLTMSSTDFDQAKSACETIRAALSERDLPTRIGPLRITASIGMAFASPKTPRSPAELIALADRCLYLAKERGRDRLVAIEAASSDSTQPLP